MNRKKSAERKSLSKKSKRGERKTTSQSEEHNLRAVYSEGRLSSPDHIRELLLDNHSKTIDAADAARYLPEACASRISK